MQLDTRIIRVDGTYQPEEIGDDHLRDFYALIHCPAVDVVSLVHDGPGRVGLDMWIDDEGLYAQEPNPLATALVRALWGDVPQMMYHGDVVLAGVNADGETIALSEMQVSVLDSLVPRLWEQLKSELPAGQ